MKNQTLTPDEVYKQVGAISGEDMVALILDPSSGYSLVRSPFEANLGSKPSDGLFFIAVENGDRKVLVPRYVFIDSVKDGNIAVSGLCPMFADLFKLLGLNNVG